MASRRLIDRVGAAALADLVALGFRKRSGQIYTVDLDSEAMGWLGLNSASEHQVSGVVEVNPVIGIRHQGIERVVAELQGLAFHEYQPPTVSINLGYLMPAARYMAWHVNTARTNGDIQDLVVSIRDYGVPYMREHSDLKAIGALLDEKVGFEHQLVYRCPVAWLVAGDRARASVALQDALNGLGKRSDAAAVELRRFAERFERWQTA